jgi:hypothetical protein
MQQPQPLLTTEQAAAQLRTNRRTLEDWRVRGGGPDFVKLRGSMVRYRPEALAAFVDAWGRTNTGGGVPEASL